MKRVLSLLLMLILSISLIAGCSQSIEEEESPKEEITNNDVEKSEIEIMELDTEALKGILNDEMTVIVDTRSTYAYNGWKMESEERGGHIEGAKSFEASWLEKFENDEAVQAELNRFEISKDKNIVTYGYGQESAKQVAEKLLSLGYENVWIYTDGFENWAKESEYKLASMPNYENLVHPQWLKDNYDKVKLFEVSWGPDGVEEYIPGAAHINTDDFEVGPLWNRKSDEEIEASLLSNGVTSDMTVVLYGADSTASARIALIMKYAGVEDVRLLDGGTESWLDSGFEMSTESADKVAVESFGVVIPQHPEYIDDMPEAKALLEDEKGRLVSIRSWTEYIGETSGYDYIEEAGRIPGAVYGFAGSDPWHMEDYRNVDNTMVSYEYIGERWADKDILSETDNGFYCGTGWRASEAWFYALSMGFENVSVYDGGWKEWSETEGNEIATGEPALN